jgi:hypothetical protein
VPAPHSAPCALELIQLSDIIGHLRPDERRHKHRLISVFERESLTGTSGKLTSTTHFALTVNPATATGSGFACQIGYTLNIEWPGGFNAAITINNIGTTAISHWTLT